MNVTEHRFYYSDGTKITDSLTINFLAKEVDSILLERKNESLNIHSSLISKNLIDPVSLDTLRMAIRKSLLESNPKNQQGVLSLSEEWLLNVGVIVFDNKKGQIVSYQNASDTLDEIGSKQLRGMSRKFFGMLMTLDSNYGGYHADSTYHYEKKEYGRTHQADYPLKRLFSSHFGGIPHYPDENFTLAEWTHACRQYMWDTELYPVNMQGGPVLTEMNLIGLHSAFTTLMNGGEYRKPSSVVMVKNEKEGTIIKALKDSRIQVINGATRSEMMELFDYYMNHGYGTYPKRILGLRDDQIVFYGRSTEQIDWLLYADDHYTIGIVTNARHVFKEKNGKYYHLRDIGYKLKSPRKCIPFLRFVLNELQNE
ncbi:MAG: hypothetical protein ACFHU9_13320 [Fluviicola sp.]